MIDPNHYQRTKEFFGSSAREKRGYYDAKIGGRLEHNPWQKLIRKMIIKRLDELFTLDKNLKSLIDVGCGNGDFCLELQHRYSELQEVYGSDFSEETLAIMKDNVASTKNIFIKKADILSLPFCDQTFDLTLCINTLHHVHRDDLSRAASELARISKKYIIIEIKNRNNFYKKYLSAQPLEKITVFPTDAKEISALFRSNGFELIEQDNIFWLKFLSPLIVLVFRKTNV